MINREPAWRILSGEFNSTTVQIKSEQKTEPNYVLTPLGAMINRVFIVGVAVEMDNIGKDNRTFYRIRLSDPTGTFYLAVGEYQPEAIRFVNNMELPTLISVIGKVKTYEPDNGGLYLSVRPEFIYPATKEIQDYWLLEAIKSLKTRIEAYTEAKKMSNPTIDQLKALGYSTTTADGIISVLELYGAVQVEDFQIFLKDGLQRLVDPNGNTTKNGGINSKKTGNIINGKNNREDVIRTNSAGTNENRNAIEKTVLEIIKKAPSQKQLGVNWNELLFQINKKGIARHEAEEAVRSLMEKGIIYEPVIGVLKKL